MIRILLFLIVVAIVLPLFYFRLKKDAGRKQMLFISGGAIAAAVGIFMQSSFSGYVSLLGVIAISLVLTLGYMKLLEKQHLKTQQQQDMKKENKTKWKVDQTESVHEPVTAKSFGMQRVARVEEEQKVEQ
ncbi:MAG: ABC-2 transporter permease [Carnobacterium alterfunditum]